MDKNQINLKTTWKAILSEVELSVSKPIFKTLFSQTFLLSLKNNTATIACPNPIVKQMIKTRHTSLLKSALNRQTKKPTQINLAVKAPQTPTPKKELGPLFSSPPLSKSNIAQKHGLNPRYSFKTLIVGNSNNFAHAAAQAIVANPGHAYNPFFIWGGVGVGKTHLIQAIGHALWEKNPAAKILYFPSETFTNELVRALQEKNITKFKNKYRRADCLLVDDIQFISGKEYSQEEFFHTFNALHLTGRQIIITSDRKPNEIPQIEERLTSRFLGGLTVDIQLPDYEMRIGILKARCTQLKTTLDQQSLEYIASSVQSNVRELEGTLLQILASAKTQNQPPSLEFIKAYFGSKPKKTQNISPKTIITAVAKYYNLKTTDILGKSRKSEIVLPRQILMYLLTDELNLSLKKTGDILGGRDHTTIIHGKEKISRLLSVNSKLRQNIIHIKQNLSA